MNIIQKIGVGLFIIAIVIFTATLGLDKYELTEDSLIVDNQYHKEEILAAAAQRGLMGEKVGSSFEYVATLKSLIKDAQKSLKEKAEVALPEGVKKWEYTLPDWKAKNYIFPTVKKSSTGPVSSNPFLFFMLTIGLGIFGGLLYILPLFNLIPGIKHNQIYHSSITRGLQLNVRVVLLAVSIIGVLVYGFYYMNKTLFWPLVSGLIAVAIIGLVLFVEKQRKF